MTSIMKRFTPIHTDSVDRKAEDVTLRGSLWLQSYSDDSKINQLALRTL